MRLYKDLLFLITTSVLRAQLNLREKNVTTIVP
jgi:hypothetical protein